MGSLIFIVLPWQATAVVASWRLCTLQVRSVLKFFSTVFFAEPKGVGAYLCNIAGNSSIAAACLVDPVDNTQAAPESADYPSACAALRKAGKAVAIIGAGVVGPCNPVGSNYQVPMC